MMMSRGHIGNCRWCTTLIRCRARARRRKTRACRSSWKSRMPTRRCQTIQPDGSTTTTGTMTMSRASRTAGRGRTVRASMRWLRCTSSLRSSRRTRRRRAGPWRCRCWCASRSLCTVGRSRWRGRAGSETGRWIATPTTAGRSAATCPLARRSRGTRTLRGRATTTMTRSPTRCGSPSPPRRTAWWSGLDKTWRCGARSPSGRPCLRGPTWRSRRRASPGDT
mmetsp:Transcript_9023/g.25446  ORF Transcript_9023/g.25446 Transcript_9023/m.25446 type:complete len:222 (+) Transcript_9023:390-1055(+)